MVREAFTLKLEREIQPNADSFFASFRGFGKECSNVVTKWDINIKNDRNNIMAQEKEKIGKDAIFHFGSIAFYCPLLFTNRGFDNILDGVEKEKATNVRENQVFVLKLIQNSDMNFDNTSNIDFEGIKKGIIILFNATITSNELVKIGNTTIAKIVSEITKTIINIMEYYNNKENVELGNKNKNENKLKYIEENYT